MPQAGNSSGAARLVEQECVEVNKHAFVVWSKSREIVSGIVARASMHSALQEVNGERKERARESSGPITILPVNGHRSTNDP